jgi:hypothetical protein
MRGESQKLGADFQAGFFSGLIIDLEADSVVLDDEIDHAAGFDEWIGFAHGQDAGIVESADDGGQIVFFRRADEEDLAVGGLRDGVEFLELKAPVIDGLVANGGFEVRAENIFSEHADDDGRAGISKGCRGPFNEFCKIEKEGGFDLIFRRLSLGEASEAEEEAKKEQRAKFTESFGIRARGHAAGFLK